MTRRGWNRRPTSEIATTRPRTLSEARQRRSAATVAAGSELGSARPAGRGALVDRLAAGQPVERVRPDRVAAGAAVDAVAAAVADVNAVGTVAGRDHIGARPSAHAIRSLARADAVGAPAARDREVAAAGGDQVAAGAAVDGRVSRAGGDPVGAGAGVDKIGSAGVDAVGARAAEQPVGAVLA